ncbi:MAG TPA: hypothetical protein VHB70_19725 [Parafilimonas sp.]|nr:hypothetical protein [Parafilimonas sp.]
MKLFENNLPIEQQNKIRQMFFERHKIPQNVRVFFERNDYGLIAESEKNLDVAVNLYEQNLSEFPKTYFPLKRLMVIYRKLKKFEDELRIINLFLSSRQNSNRKAEIIKMIKRRDRVLSLLEKQN